MKICHITSAHPTFDIRIFHKECVSLAEAGFEVSLVCTSTKNNTFYEKGVKIIQVQTNSKSRFYRMVTSVNQVYKAAINENADAYHLHDPELIRLIPRFWRHHKQIVYDAHEDLPKQIMGKYYLPIPIRKSVARLAALAERHYLKRATAIIAAVETIANHYSWKKERVITLNNYPLKEEFQGIDTLKPHGQHLCYVGSITVIRGICEVVDALAISKTTLQIAGSYAPLTLRERLQEKQGWQFVVENGVVSRGKIAEILANSSAGVVLFHPLPNHIDAQPTKMFEYMAAGLPVIASNFPLWRSIIEANNCGICVDPMNVEQIAEAITMLQTNPDKAKSMGQSGRKAFLDKYNWDAEKPKLINLYKELASSL